MTRRSRNWGKGRSRAAAARRRVREARFAVVYRAEMEKAVQALSEYITEVFGPVPPMPREFYGISYGLTSK